MPRKKAAAPAAPETTEAVVVEEVKADEAKAEAEKPAKAPKAPKAPRASRAAKAADKAEKAEKPAVRRSRPPLTPEVYVEQGGKQYNVSDIIERAKADYRATHKVGVQSCKIYIKPEESTAYYVVNKVEGKLPLEQ